MSARTHNEIKINNVNYIEQLKRLNVYDELIALKKLPVSKINSIVFEKSNYNNDTAEQQLIDKACETRKSALYLQF